MNTDRKKEAVLTTSLRRSHHGDTAFKMLTSYEAQKHDSQNVQAYEDAVLHRLDRCGVYGHNIWRLIMNTCQENLALADVYLRAVEMNILDQPDLIAALMNQKILDREVIWQRVAAMDARRQAPPGPAGP